MLSQKFYKPSGADNVWALFFTRVIFTRVFTRDPTELILPLVITYGYYILVTSLLSTHNHPSLRTPTSITIIVKRVTSAVHHLFVVTGSGIIITCQAYSCPLHCAQTSVAIVTERVPCVVN